VRILVVGETPSTARLTRAPHDGCCVVPAGKGITCGRAANSQHAVYCILPKKFRAEDAESPVSPCLPLAVSKFLTVRIRVNLLNSRQAQVRGPCLAPWINPWPWAVSIAWRRRLAHTINTDSIKGSGSLSIILEIQIAAASWDLLLVDERLCDLEALDKKIG